MSEPNKKGYSSLTGFKRAVPIILIALSVFIALCFITESTGAFGRIIASVLRGLFAGGAYIIPALLALHAVFYAEDVNESRLTSRIIFSAVALVTLSSLIFTIANFGEDIKFSAVEFYKLGTEGRGGGFIGSAVAFVIIKVFGYVGLILIALATIALYVTYFFARGRGAAKRSAIRAIGFILKVCTAVESALRYVFSGSKRRRQEKLDRLEQEKTEELFDDEYFAVDNGLQELYIPALGIHESRSLKSIEANPTLQKTVFHKSAAEIKETQEAPDVTKSRVNLDYGFDAELQKHKASTSEPIFKSDVENERIRYGLDCNADDIFTKSFNPMDFTANEDEARRPSTKGQASFASDAAYERAAEIKESVRSISVEDIEMARRKADMDMKREAMSASFKPLESTVTPESDIREEATESDGDYARERYMRAAQFISGVTADYGRTVNTSAYEPSRTVRDNSPLQSAPTPSPITTEQKAEPMPAATQYTVDSEITESEPQNVPEKIEIIIPDKIKVVTPKTEEISVARSMLSPTPTSFDFTVESPVDEPSDDEDEVEVMTEYGNGEVQIIEDEDDDTADEANDSRVLVEPTHKLYTYDDNLADEAASDDAPPFEIDEDVSVKKEAPKKKADYKDYVYPSIELLGRGSSQIDENLNEEMEENGNRIIETLASFNVLASIKGYDRGPRITRYEVVPSKGVRVNQVINLFDDIALSLAADGIRIEAPIPGKSAIGFEIPNKNPETVRLRDLLEDEQFKNAPSKTLACIGKDVTGVPVFGDISKMPHVLIAGATGMGKSVCINSILISMLYRARPDELKLILIDPKKVEFKMYNGIPHLLVPVVTEAKQAAGALMWAVEEMERRYDVIEALNVRNIEVYNQEIAKNPKLGEPLPKIIIVIDELNDLMLQVRDPIEGLIMSISQKARAAGIHLIIGTQRPSVNVITGVIKANIVSRISCKVASYQDSKTILDQAGAERLLDKGDMLYYTPSGGLKPKRVQSAFVSDPEVYAVMDALRANAGESTYDESVMEDINRAAQKCVKTKGGGEDRGERESGDSDGGGYLNDSQFRDAVELAVTSGKISTSLIQRRIGVGYGKAAKFIDVMEDMGIVSPPNGQKPRDALITKDEWDEKLYKISLD